MSFSQAVRTCLNKYTDFSGRASRSEYWWWALFYFIGWLITIVFGKVVFLWEIALFIPSLAVGVRRMHDSNHSGWWIICPLANIIFLLFPSVEPNRFAAPSPRRDLIDETQISPTSSVCASCGKLRLPGQNYCQGCGAKF
jgi:heme/copper-type cytochrome/quinol oxidase subunit 2